MSKNPLTIEAFAEWCEKQPARKKYDYFATQGCALFKYFTDIGLQPTSVGGFTWEDVTGKRRPISASYRKAVRSQPRTFGALAARLRSLSA